MVVRLGPVGIEAQTYPGLSTSSLVQIEIMSPTL
jgi:hypothetical protein